DPMRAARELNLLALFTEQKKSSDDRPQDALKIPAPKGRNLTLTENAASPFHAEPRQVGQGNGGPAEHWSRDGLLLLRHVTPLSTRNVVNFCSGAYTEGDSFAGGFDNHM